MYHIILRKSEVARNRKNASLFGNPEKSVHVKLDSLKHAGPFKPLLKFHCDGEDACSKINFSLILSLKLFQHQRQSIYDFREWCGPCTGFFFPTFFSVRCNHVLSPLNYCSHSIHFQDTWAVTLYWGYYHVLFYCLEKMISRIGRQVVLG